MTKRQKVARWMRKWADLIDPRIDPSSGVTIRVTADTSDAEAKIARLAAECERLAALQAKVTLQ